MLFNSFSFLLFLPVVFLAHWFLCKGARQQNTFLLIASYFFYGCWDVRFMLLLGGVTLVAYYTGELLNRGYTQRLRRIILTACIVLNLGVLCAFKYFDFFYENFALLLRAVGFDADSVTLKLILPVGISFFTFQAIGYVVDVYRNQLRAERDVIKFAVFISFFPQLVAGPIERATNLLPQFARKREFDETLGVSGLKLILWGLFKKMVVADNAASVVNAIFPDYASAGTINLWIGGVLFAFQIYGDFSGYSDIAIGTGRLFGIRLMKNFDKPYLSKNIAEFWRRWHISLTSWFRDYVYIPLGGNRRGSRRTLANRLGVFLLSGLWHGANFTFIAWGGFHGVMTTLSRKRAANAPSSQSGGVRVFFDTFNIGITFLLVMVGFIIFRADTLPHAIDYIIDMWRWVPYATVMGKAALVWVMALVIIEVLTRHRDTPFDFSGHGLMRYRTCRWMVYLIFVVVTLVFSGTQEQFIYFQF